MVTVQEAVLTRNSERLLQREQAIVADYGWCSKLLICWTGHGRSIACMWFLDVAKSDSVSKLFSISQYVQLIS